MTEQRDRPQDSASVQTAFAALRERTPDPLLITRLERAVQAEQTREDAVRDSRPTWLWVALPIAAAGGLAFAAAVLHRVEAREAALHERAHNVTVALGDDGSHELEFPLDLTPHGDEFPLVEVEAPHGTWIRHNATDSVPSQCNVTHCTYRLAHPSPAQPVRSLTIATQKPGQYRIRASHSSKKSRVNEHIWLDVQP